MDEANFEMITNELTQKLANGNDHIFEQFFEQYVRDILCEEYDRGFCDGYNEGGRDVIKQCGY